MQEPVETPVRALNKLLLALFSGEEFRRWLRSGPDATVEPEIPPDLASPAAVIDGAVAVLTREGRIDARFFVRLLDERPLQRDEIMRIAALWSGPERGRTKMWASRVSAAAGSRWLRVVFGSVTVLLVAALADKCGVFGLRAPVVDVPPPLPRDEMRIEDVRWRGPIDRCNYAGEEIGTASVDDRELEVLTRAGYFLRSSNAVFSFDLHATRLVKLVDIEVSASAQRSPWESQCTWARPEEQAHLYGIVLEPSWVPRRFAAQLQGAVAPTSIRLEPDRPEEFYVLLVSRVAAIYDVHHVFVRYTVDGEEREVAHPIHRRIAFN